MNILDDLRARAARFKKKDIAERSGLSPRTVGEVLSGKRDPQMATVNAIAEGLFQLEREKESAENS